MPRNNHRGRHEHCDAPCDIMRVPRHHPGARGATILSVSDFIVASFRRKRNSGRAETVHLVSKLAMAPSCGAKYVKPAVMEHYSGFDEVTCKACRRIIERSW